jgi:hypothetical protein
MSEHERVSFLRRLFGGTHRFLFVLLQAPEQQSQQYSSANARNPFRRSFLLNMQDRLMGIAYGLQRRDRLYDPVQAFKDELLRRVLPRIPDFNAKIIQLQMSSARRTAARNDAIKEQEVVLKNETAAGTIALNVLEEQTQLLAEGTDELKDARNEFDAWRKAVGRLPYSERFKALARDRRLRQLSEIDATTATRHGVGGDNSANADNPDSALRRAARAVRGLISNILGIFIVAALPGEILFTLPSFMFLLEDAPLSALAAAVLFTLALVVLGEAIGSFSSRMIKHKVINKEDASYALQSRANWPAMAATITLFLFAFYCAGSGASLRALLPEIQSLKSQQDDATEKMRLMMSMRGAVQSEQQLVATAGAAAALEGKKRELLQHFFRFFETTDGHVAFVVYVVLIFSAAIKRRFSEDPIREYELASARYGEVRIAWAWHLVTNRNAIASLRAKSEENRNWLDSLRVGSPDVIPPLKQMSEQIADIDAELKQTELRKSNTERDLRLFIRTHSRRFVIYYAAFRFGMPTEVRRQLQNHFAPQLNVAAGSRGEYDDQHTARARRAS